MVRAIPIAKTALTSRFNFISFSSFYEYSQNITMPAQSKKSAAPAKWLVQRSAFCTLGIYRPLR